MSLPKSPASFMRRRLSSGLRSDVQDVEKEPVGLGVAAQVSVESAAATGVTSLSALRVIFQPVPVGQPEQPQQIDRVALEDLLVGGVDAVVVGHEKSLEPAICDAGARTTGRSG